jgi:hypothetical protein
MGRFSRNPSAVFFYAHRIVSVFYGAFTYADAAIRFHDSLTSARCPGSPDRHCSNVRFPGAPEGDDEMPAGSSSLPDDLRALGYDVVVAGDGDWVLPHQIVQRFVRRADGELEPMTEGSAMPSAETRTHVGIVRIERWASSIP